MLIMLYMLVAILALAVGIVALHHIFRRIEEHRYSRPGQLVETGNGKVHIFAKRGPAGRPVYVFLDSFGGGSAYYDFKMLWEPLSEAASVITVDYLGYGMSEETDAERSVHNFVRELDAALEASDIPGPYTIVAHSMGGFHAAGYALRFPERVAALVMIDNTPPARSLIDTSEHDMMRKMKPKYDFMNFTGLIRTKGRRARVPGLTEEEINANTYYGRKRGLGRTVMNEISSTHANALYLANNRMDDSIPMLMLLSARNEERSKGAGWGKTWVGFHEDYLTDNPCSRIEMFDTGHYIHRAEPENVIRTIDAFTTEKG